jgi:putative molybdopterin biosynthesis protein
MKLRASIKRFRVQRGLTQQELARLVGLSRQSLNHIENGSTVPSAVVALQLARSLGCRVEDLFELGDVEGGLRATLAMPMRATSTKASPRVVIGSISGRWVAHRLDPRQRPRDLTVAADAVLSQAGRAGPPRFQAAGGLAPARRESSARRLRSGPGAAGRSR